MKESLSRIWQVTASECCGSARSRRVLVVMLLYVVAAVACMAVVTNMLGKIEAELVKLMQLPASDHTGLVSAALWKSQHFRWIVENFVRDRLVFQDIVGRHPVELIYAWFAIMFSPMLAVLAASNRVSDDLRSGSARYVIVRVARIEWTLGKYIGQAAIIAVALAASAFGAWVTAACMLSGVGAWDLLPAMFEWSARAGVLKNTGLREPTRSSSAPQVLPRPCAWWRSFCVRHGGRSCILEPTRPAHPGS